MAFAKALRATKDGSDHDGNHDFLHHSIFHNILDIQKKFGDIFEVQTIKKNEKNQENEKNLFSYENVKNMNNREEIDYKKIFQVVLCDIFLIKYNKSRGFILIRHIKKADKNVAY